MFHFSEEICVEADPEDEEAEDVSCQQYLRTWEESLLVFAVPGSWFYLMFFAGLVLLLHLIHVSGRSS